MQQFIYFVKGSLDCASCKAILATQLKGESAKEYGKYLGEHGDEQQKYNSSLEKWEEAFESSLTGRVKNSATQFQLPVRVVAEEAVESRGEELKGVFWPDWKWKQVKGTEIPKGQLKSRMHKGKKMGLGAPTCGWVRGRLHQDY